MAVPADLEREWHLRLGERVGHELTCTEGCRRGDREHCPEGRRLADAEQGAYHGWFTSRFASAEGVVL